MFMHSGAKEGPQNLLTGLRWPLGFFLSFFSILDYFYRVARIEPHRLGYSSDIGTQIYLIEKNNILKM